MVQSDNATEPDTDPLRPRPRGALRRALGPRRARAAVDREPRRVVQLRNIEAGDDADQGVLPAAPLGRPAQALHGLHELTGAVGLHSVTKKG